MSDSAAQRWSELQRGRGIPAEILDRVGEVGGVLDALVRPRWAATLTWQT